MSPINPDDPKSLKNFIHEWQTHYTERNPVIPPNLSTMRSLWQYYDEGSIPGDLAMAVLSNDLYTAFNKAQRNELDTIYGTVLYVTIYFPTECYGSYDKVGMYIERKRRDKAGQRTRFY